MLLVLAISVLFGFITGIVAEIKSKGDLGSCMLAGMLFGIASGMFFTALAFSIVYLIKIGVVFS